MPRLPKLSFLSTPLELAPFYHALCSLVIAILAYTGLSIHPFSQADWLILSAVLFSQAGLGAELSWRYAWQMLFYPLWGSLTALTVLALSWLSASTLVTAPLVFIITLAAAYLGWQKRQYYFASFTLSLLTMIAAFLPCDSEMALERSYLLLLGSFLVFMVRLPFFLYRRSREFYFARASFFQKLKALYPFIFHVPEQSDSPLDQNFEEGPYQAAWSVCLAPLLLLKARASLPYRESLDKIWDLTLGLGSLRYRLTDYSILTMSKNELQTILASILAILDRLAGSSSKTTALTLCEAFQTAIQHFEELYQAMLQTLAKEPLVLLLFIQDLYALKEEAEKMFLASSEQRGAL